MRVLGIDPGYAIVGWGVVDYAGNRFAPVDFGAVCTDAGVPFERRLDEVYAGIKEVIERTRPEVLAIEKLFYQHNQTTVIGVAEARGVILLAAAQAGLPIYEYTPMQVKQAVTGYGKAVKKQVQEMTRVLLHLARRAQSRTIPPMRWQWPSPSATPTATSSTALSAVWPGRSDPLTGSVRLQRRGTGALPKGELNRENWPTQKLRGL